MSEQGKNSQGEGDRESDRRYRERARQFVDEGRVGAAAAAAEAALDGAEADELRRAELVGKSRIAEEDPQSGEGPLPSFWTDEQQSAWDRVKDAFRRDWLQTKADLHLAGGADLEQTAKDTLKQATGQQPRPGTAYAQLGWDLARHAIRLGHGAATFWTWEADWSEELEQRVRREWEDLGTGIDWVIARPLVRHGWDQGRKDVAPARDA